MTERPVSMPVLEPIPGATGDRGRTTGPARPVRPGVGRRHRRQRRQREVGLRRLPPAARRRCRPAGPPRQPAGATVLGRPTLRRLTEVPGPRRPRRDLRAGAGVRRSGGRCPRSRGARHRRHHRGAGRVERPGPGDRARGARARTRGRRGAGRTELPRRRRHHHPAAAHQRPFTAGSVPCCPRAETSPWTSTTCSRSAGSASPGSCRSATRPTYPRRPRPRLRGARGHARDRGVRRGPASTAAASPRPRGRRTRRGNRWCCWRQGVAPRRAAAPPRTPVVDQPEPCRRRGVRRRVGTPRGHTRRDGRPARRRWPAPPRPRPAGRGAHRRRWPRCHRR